MKCPRCQQANSSHAKFCPECGTPLKGTGEAAPPGASYAELQRALSEGLEQQTATAEILRVISSSPTDIQPVLDAITESAARLCRTELSLLFRTEGDAMRVASAHGTPIPGLEKGAVMPLDRGSGTGRAILERRTIHVQDASTVSESDLPTTKAFQQVGGYRTYLATPLLREGVPIGTLNVGRMDVRPLTDKQIALLETFADQAVIAIENVPP